jgi:nucleotide-binding universal stress UspA family protein
MKRYQRILVPVDNSKLSEDAFEQALGLAQMTSGEVTVVHVVELIPFIHSAPSEDRIFVPTGETVVSEERVDDMLNQYAKKGKEMDVTVHKKIAKGNVSEEIIRASTEYDIVILGTLGRNALASLLLGSTAEKVARHACCPVMLVREIGTECRI